LSGQVLKSGTTTVGFVGRDFVVLATDTRATAGFLWRIGRLESFIRLLIILR